MIGSSRYFIAVLNKTPYKDESDVNEITSTQDYFLAKTYAGAEAKAKELAARNPHYAVRIGKFTEEFSVTPTPTVGRKEINQDVFALDSFYLPPMPWPSARLAKYGFENDPNTPLIDKLYKTFNDRKRSI